MFKSSRHSKITGDFAEALVLYWLSKYGYECARVDHTGIDLIARSPGSPEVMGISVKSRSRYAGREAMSVNIPPDGFDKARRACDTFNCAPYYAIVVDGASIIRCFLLSLGHLELLVGTGGKMLYWQMNHRCLASYHADPQVRGFELQTQNCSWGTSSYS
jgi:Holliday junction resolvase-like predicted endonuclease